MAAYATLGILVALGAFGFVWLARFLRAESDRVRAESGTQLAERNAEVDRRLVGMIETMDRRLGELDGKVDRRLSDLDTKVDRRMESASQTSQKIHERLGKVGEATDQMLERAKDLARLEQALRPPKARGGFGEYLLGTLLADIFPRDKYELQYGFRGGERVDAVIRIDRSLVPVDAKFPLDNFQRIVEAESDAERELHAKQFCRDVKGHVDAIADKYIRPEEGTYEFALMYLPAEAVYYELVCGRLGGDASPLAYALERRVIPVSPSTLHAYLMVLVLGFKGMQIEEHAREVMAYCGQLTRDFGRFREDFELVGTHLGRAQSKYVEAEKRMGKFETKLERAAESDVPALVESPPELPRALDAA